MFKTISKLLQAHFPTAKHKEAFYFGLIYYFSSSVILTLITKGVGLWMFDMKYSLVYLAFLMSLLHTPNSARIIFAAWLDYMPIYEVMNLGYRKSMMFWCKLVCIFGLLGMAYFTPAYHFGFLIFAFITAIFSAVLESVTNAYFNTVYSKEHKPSWIQAGQLGHQFGIWMVRAGALYLSLFLPWHVIYAFATIFILLSMLSLPFSPNCAFIRQPKPKSIVEVYTTSIRSFYNSHKSYMKYLLPFMLFYRAPDQILGPVISFLQLDLFGKEITALITTISLTAGTIIGGFIWKHFAKDEYVRLRRLGILHSFFMVIIGICVWIYGSFASNALLYAIGVLFCLLRLARTMESAAIFTYQCSLWDVRYFNAQYAFGNFLDKILGEIFAAQAGLAISFLGWPAFLIFISLTNAPAVWGINLLKRNKVVVDGNCPITKEV